jgi:hypothetical protein
MISMPFMILALLAADPTKPNLVALDFKDRPLPEVVAAIAARSGNPVVMQFYNDLENNPRKVTLLAAEPVPFWDAIDRFCLETKIDRTLNDGGPLGMREPSIALYGPGVDPGLAQYSGPFRFGKFTLQTDYRKSYAPSPRSTDESEEGYRAQFEVLPEPRVLAIRTGPLAKLEALDDANRSLLDPKVSDPEKVSGQVNGYALGGYQSVLRVKLATPQPGSKRLKVLRGVLPVEVAIPPKAPTLVIPLAESVGKSFKAGDVRITIEEFDTKPGGPTILKVVAKIEGARGPGVTTNKALVWTRSSMIARSLEVVDGRGQPLVGSTPSTFGGDELRRTFRFDPVGPGRPGAVPKTLRVYAPEWVAWEAPFEFRDVPLP